MTLWCEKTSLVTDSPSLLLQVGKPYFKYIGVFAPTSTTPSSGAPPASLRLKEDLFPDLTRSYANLGGRHLRFLAMRMNPWFLVSHVAEDNTLTPTSGPEFQVIKTLAQANNFTYTVRLPDDGNWGGPQENGEVTGMIGMVYRHEADAAVSLITITDKRETVVDFTSPYLLDVTTILSKAPAQVSRSLALLRPFTNFVWTGLVVAVALAGVVALLVTLASNGVARDSNRGGRGGDYAPRGGRKEAVWSIDSVQYFTFNMFRSVVFQDDLTRPREVAPRIVAMAWYFFCLNVYVVYAGVLTSFLTRPSFEDPIDSLYDLLEAVEKRGAGFGFGKDTSQEYIFRFAESGIYADLWRNFDPSYYPGSRMRGVEKVLEENYNLITSKLVLRAIISKIGASKFYLANEAFYLQPFGIPCSKGNPLREAFSRTVLSLQEAGIYNKWVHDVTGSASSKSLALDELPVLSLEHMQSSLILFGLGMGLALLTMLVELCSSSLVSSKGQNET
ncbi:putative glutamate receptor [Oratosquilla oratoria]|uniref:putative glutamate receptor n=1 Tax=Oratosquilla oratoria TaxID=337810 RepID=UPI003F773A66